MQIFELGGAPMTAKVLSAVLLGFASISLVAQLDAADLPSTRTQGDQSAPIYRMTLVERTIKAINYRHLSGSTMIDFRGTPLLPRARGNARVESKRGRMQIDAKFDDLTPATQFGLEYLTYILWAVTPEGRATNLGEILLKGDDNKISVTTDLQAFGLMVTAEPYFAVTQPSDLVVLENEVRSDTAGTIEQVNAKYELLPRGRYVVSVKPSELRPMQLDPKVPLELYEAENAVRIAGFAGADRYAADTFRKAQSQLQDAEDAQNHKGGKKPVAQSAREAVQTAEDARLIAVKREQEGALANERAAAAAREAKATATAESEKQQRERAEAERLAAERGKAEADQARQQAEVTAERANKGKAEAEAEAERARTTAAQSEQDKMELRKQLREQLNIILETRETARGLIVNMSDVLFDFGKSTLKPGAREKLAKIAGILLAHPDLKIEVEGHTDSVGSDELNQRLSEDRAAAVRDYLVQQGVHSENITARGFGKTRPVASNDTAAGRQLNRRVELVVSGESIGAPSAPAPGV
jgi:outer membrane protein OmpA-like peptidoglycan-associated protein